MAKGFSIGGLLSDAARSLSNSAKALFSLVSSQKNTHALSSAIRRAERLHSSSGQSNSLKSTAKSLNNADVSKQPQGRSDPEPVRADRKGVAAVEKRLEKGGVVFKKSKMESATKAPLTPKEALSRMASERSNGGFKQQSEVRATDNSKPASIKDLVSKEQVDSFKERQAASKSQESGMER
jgi:hypothetical protein